MDLPRGRLCSQSSTMKELETVHHRFMLGINILQVKHCEERVTEDFSYRKLSVELQHFL